MFTDRHDDRYGGRIPSKKRKTKVAIFKIILSFFWQPVKCLEQWLNMFMSSLAKNNLCCMVWNFLQPVHLITVDNSKQRVAVVQPTENKRTHQLSGGFCCQEMMDQANSSDLEIC